MPWIWAFGIIPLLDLLVGEDRNNPTDEQMKRLAGTRLYRWVTWAYVPVQWALVLWGAWVLTHRAPTLLEAVGVTMSVGLTTGAIGITFAHEMGHKPNRWEQLLAEITLGAVGYMHFQIEHNHGHHSNVATRRDPATSRFGESFYRFYPRSVFGGWFSAWRIEVDRLRKLGKPAWSPANRMFVYTAIPSATTLMLGSGWGWGAAVFFVAQAVVAFSLLELVNYLEHYGLERRETAPGRYERVTALHSWNSNHSITNAFLIMLQRHSDHHAHPLRRYQTLRHFDESPQLPTGYAGMVLLALIPPLWRRVMDPRVIAHRERLAHRELAPTPVA